MGVFRLTRLRHFCMVAEKSSIGLAARVLKLSQPALTRSIHRLEQDFGEELFERSPRGVTLSPLGRTLLPYAKSILAEADRAMEDWRNLKLQGSRRSRVKLGISPNFVRHVVPDAVEQFIGHHPEANVEVVTGTAEQLLAMLSSAQIDLALILVWRGTMDAALGRTLSVTQKKLARLTAAVYAPSTHPLAKKRSVSLKDLQHERWAVPHSLSISYVFRNAFLEEGLEPPPEVLFTSNLSLIVEMSRRLGLLTIVPEHVVAAEIAQGQMAALHCKQLQLDYTVSLLSRLRGSHTPELNYFVSLLQKEVRKLGIRLEPGDVEPLPAGEIQRSRTPKARQPRSARA